MSFDSNSSTTVLAVYYARHFADMARDHLETEGITAYVSADDVHVPLQLTEGARLIVLERDAEAARSSLAGASLLPDDVGQDRAAEEE